MKKIMALAVVTSILLVGASPALARGRFHGPGRGGGPVWAALGLGLLAGAVVVDLLNRPKPVCPLVVVTPAPPVVVPEPTVVAPPGQTPSSAVMVNAARLNIRSGPGYQNPVVAVVQRGASLAVHAIDQGWLYVQSPSGRFGWVARQFTSPVASPASG